MLKIKSRFKSLPCTKLKSKCMKDLNMKIETNDWTQNVHIDICDTYMYT